MKKKGVLLLSMLLLMLAGCSSDDDEITINDKNILGYWERESDKEWGTGGLLFSSNGEIKLWDYGVRSADDSGPLTYSERHWGYFWFDDEGTIHIQNRTKDSSPNPDESYYAVTSLTNTLLVIRVYGGFAGTSLEEGFDEVFAKMTSMPYKKYYSIIQNNTMKRICQLLGMTVVLSLGLQSCSSSDDDVDLGEAKQVINMLSEPVPIILTPEQKVFANDNNSFTLNFLKTVNETDRSGKSFIYSPLSITYVLGMVNDAATGLTEKELEETLGFHQGGIQAVNDYCKNLIEGLPKVDEKVTLNIANAIFLNKDWTLKPQFEQDMQTYYDAKAEALDFKAPETLDHINGWCKEKTNGIIPSILDDIDPSMVSYLLNAIYFKADWASKFDEKNTRDETFTNEEGHATTLPLMHQNVLIKYMKNDTFSAIEMPYGNGMWSMNVLLPEEGKTTDDIINYLAQIGWSKDYIIDNKQYDVISPLNGVSPYEVDLKLPRFETSSDTDDIKFDANDIKDGLIGLLQKMGINRAFIDGVAEFPNMCEAPVYIEMMRQKAKIKVSEEGSEAAAVTVAGANYESGSATPPEFPKATFHANRSFVYVIREVSSGIILFVGKFTGQ